MSNRETLNGAQAICEYLGISRTTLYRWEQHQNIPGLRKTLTGRMSMLVEDADSLITSGFNAMPENRETK